MWREDSSLALARVDQPQVLQFVPTAISKRALDSTNGRNRSNNVFGDCVWTGFEACTTAAVDPTQYNFGEPRKLASTRAFNRY